MSNNCSSASSSCVRGRPFDNELASSDRPTEEARGIDEGATKDASGGPFNNVPLGETEETKKQKCQ